MGCGGAKNKNKEEKLQNTEAKNNNNEGLEKEGKFAIGPESFISLKSTPISADYKFMELLGEGAFGTVRLVKHKSTGLTRAMKIIDQAKLRGLKQEESKLFAEVNILKTLDHVNILKLIELFQDDQNYYLITEMCQGGELYKRIIERDSFTEAEVASYMKQILSAITYCHSKQIIHRDLKPENLLFDTDQEDANLQVIDFGISTKHDPTQKETKSLGTPYYMAPEVIQRNYDEKCDIWSAGVILYILLCGYPPFQGDNAEEIISNVLKAEVKFDDVEWNAVSQEAKDLVQKMLTKDFKQRPGAQECLNDPWIQKNNQNHTLNNQAMNNLKGFYSTSQIRSAILMFIATNIISSNEKEELQKAFQAIDINGDGTLSKEQMIEGYMRTTYKDKDEATQIVNQIFQKIDSNGSNKVDFSEFITAAMDKEQLLSKQKMEQAFQMFDQDGNGQIDQKELQNIMGGTQIDEKAWQEILKDCDTNKDGMISQAEFIELLTKKIN